jgi:hypothetical protein
MRLKEKSSAPQHEQGLGALRSNRITHMAPRLPGVVRQAQAPIKGAAPGDEGSGEEDDEEEETERLPHFFQGFEDEDEEREGVGQGPEPPRIVPSRYELEPDETPRYWQKFSGDGKQRESKATAMRQLKARAKAGKIDALQELQEMVMASLMTELDSEPDEAPRTSHSEASRRAVYVEYSPLPRSSVRPIRLPLPPSHVTSAKRPDILKMTIKGIDVSSTTSAQNTLYLFQALLHTAGVPEKGGTPEQDADLGMMVTTWVADSAKIVTSLRTTCGGAASGASK